MNPIKRIALTLTLAATAAFAAGCGDDGNGNDVTDDAVANDATDVVAVDTVGDTADDTRDVPVVTTGYSAGMGITDISGDVGTRMGGYGFCMGAPDYCRYAEGTHDPLLATAIAVRDNATGEGVIMITCDVVGILRYDIDQIHAAAVERFKQEFGIDDFDGHRLIITATHTHHSTDTMGLWGPLDGSGRDEEYAAFMRDQILDAAVAAWADLKPAKIFFNDTGVAPNYDDDKYADDTKISTLRFANPETNATMFTMTRWTAHVTNYPEQLKGFSAGHPGTFRKAMQNLTGAPAAYFQGMVGSVYTEGYMFDKPGEEPCQMADMFPDGYQDPDLPAAETSELACLGTGLAQLAFDAMKDERPVPETGIKYRYRKFGFHPEAKYPVMLDYTMFSYVDLGPLHFEVPPADQIDNPESTMDTHFSWATIGDINLITTPGEGFPLFGKEIEQVLSRAGGKVLTLGLGQDWLGYIPAWQQWQEEDDQIVYNKALSAGQYLPVRYLEELQTLVTAETTVGPDCEGTARKCSDDGYSVMECHSGLWIDVENCMTTAGRLCDAQADGGTAVACVDPWKWGNPVWDKCADDPLATPETLVEKATYYDDIAMRLHFHPQLKWIAPVSLPKAEVTCPEGVTGPCYAPAVSEATATWEDVETWQTGENDGLWSGLFLASQAYRYAVTRDAVALENIRQLMEGEKWRIEITGVSGLFTRQYIPTGVAGISCPTDLNMYVPDVEKDDNKWLSINFDGCIETVNPDTMEWVTSGVCGLEDYAGWCLLDNVSQDEYAGHMFALGAVWRLVDDNQIKAAAARMIGQVGDHLMKNWLHFVDWDGRDTEHGKLNIYSFADSPGFLAIHSLDFILMAAQATGRADLLKFYNNCLLQKAGGPCEGWPYPEPAYDTEIANLILYPDTKGCKANYNNFGMVFAAIHHLAWNLRDPALLNIVQDAWENHFMDEGNRERAMRLQKNPWYNFGFAALKKLDATHPHAYDLVRDGVCSLREFRATQAQHAGNSAVTYGEYCETRFAGDFAAENIVPVPERCATTFEWWGDPYDREMCGDAPWNVEVPTGYLLPYWMGRYYGFIDESM